MGYRSDIVIAFAFASEKHLAEVLAIYQMNELVKTHDLLQDWSTHTWGKTWALTFVSHSVKWYDGYEDVIGIGHMHEVVQAFAEERGEDFNFAYKKIRLGESFDDVDYESDYTNDSAGIGIDLIRVIDSRIDIRRELVVDLQ